ncbi:MAG: hypothetical protein O7J95_10640 [Planctomycetota bacterium]|nr:hypothetical protein [Planctomycetota bacterium]
MGLFKSRDEKRLEREIEIRKGVQLIKRNIRDLGRNEKDYLAKARRARELESKDQLEFLKQTLKRTASQKRLLERQLLNIETAVQIKNQAETNAGFARAMNSLSRSIGEMFGSTNMAKTQKQFEKAMAQAESLEQQMELFLDMSSQSMFGYEPSGEEIVTDEEIDRLIAQPSAAESADGEIRAGVEEIRQQMGKETAGDESSR